MVPIGVCKDLKVEIEDGEVAATIEGGDERDLYETKKMFSSCFCTNNNVKMMSCEKFDSP